MLTDRAARKFEDYLAAVRRHADPADADDIVAQLREHVAIHAEAGERPLDFQALNVLLERLGEPQDYAVEAPHSPDWMAGLSLLLGVGGIVLASFDRWPMIALVIAISGGLIAIGGKFRAPVGHLLSLYGRLTGWALGAGMLSAPALLLWVQAQRGGLLESVFGPLTPEANFNVTLLLAMAGLTAVTSVVLGSLWPRLRALSLLLDRRLLVAIGTALILMLLVAALFKYFAN